MKCGGKSAAFTKPGPNHKFVADRRESGRAAAINRQAKFGERWRELHILINEHKNLAWSKRAGEDLEPYLEAALEGKYSHELSCGCMCKHGVPHHVMCMKSGKPREADKVVMNRVKGFLRKVADAAKVRPEAFERCTRASHPAAHPAAASPEASLL